jgi:hypothetical protein
MANTAHVFTPLIDSDSITSFKTNVESEIQKIIDNGTLMANIECQYQQSDKYMSCLIIVRG